MVYKGLGMKHFTKFLGLQTLILTVAMALSSCGSKNKDDSNRTGDGSQGSGDQSGKSGEAGAKGDRGDQGPAGSKGDQGTKGDGGSNASALSYAVKDNGGVTIAVTDYYNYSQFLFSSDIYAKTSDGVSLRVNINSGRNSGHFCYFASVDCSGTCLHPFKTGEKNVLVESAAALFKVTGAEAGTTQAYQSYAVADNPAPSCTTLGAPVMASMISVATAWTPPAPLTYPFAAPLTVQ